MKTENFKDSKLYSKNQRRKLVNEAAERLAEILIMQVELRKNKKSRIRKPAEKLALGME